ncbi:MAG: transcriptional regulator GcvA [Pseudomonadota bacterium]
MRDRLPPLTALRAFASAARHMSFAKAAEELSVTPAALSFQIKSLETHLGAPLFVRLNRAVALTPSGQALAPFAQDGFDLLSQGWQAARRALDTGVLTVTAGPAFTAKVLAPRLFKFGAAHPEIELRFAATLRLLDFDRDNVDLAIRFGLERDVHLFSEPLYKGWISPMMHPDVAARVTTPQSLLDEVLIHDDSLSFLSANPDWARWFAHAGVAHGPLKGPRFSQADHAIDMALAGEGVVLGRSSIALSALHSGALVAPFSLALGSDAHYRIVCAQGREDMPAIAAFRAWIKAEMDAETALSTDRNIVMVG